MRLSASDPKLLSPSRNQSRPINESQPSGACSLAARCALHVVSSDCHAPSSVAALTTRDGSISATATATTAAVGRSVFLIRVELPVDVQQWQERSSAKAIQSLYCDSCTVLS